MSIRKRILHSTAVVAVTVMTVLGLSVTGAGAANATTLDASGSPSAVSHLAPQEGIATACEFTVWSPAITSILGLHANNGYAIFQGCNVPVGHCRFTVTLEYQADGVWWTQPAGSTTNTGWVDCNGVIGYKYRASYICSNPNIYTQWRTHAEVLFDEGPGTQVEDWYDNAQSGEFCL